MVDWSVLPFQRRNHVSLSMTRELCADWVQRQGGARVLHCSFRCYTMLQIRMHPPPWNARGDLCWDLI